MGQNFSEWSLAMDAAYIQAVNSGANSGYYATVASKPSERAIGFCYIPYWSRPSLPEKMWITPNGMAEDYFMKPGAKTQPKTIIGSIVLTVPPKHGVIVKSVYNEYEYIPNTNYLGRDTFEFVVEANGAPLRVVYDVMVQNEISGDGEDNRREIIERKYCKKMTWKISLNDFVIEKAGVDYLQSHLELLKFARQASQSVDGFSDLLGTAVGNTTVTGTADPTVWQAKAGSAAEGKMDMLSVLLHEYGHVLGLEHSQDVRDFMGPSLAAGMRRLPTEEELQRTAVLSAALNLAADNAPAPSAPWTLLQALFGLPLLRPDSTTDDQPSKEVPTKA